MTITEYKRRVIELFRSGSATNEQWEELASLVLRASEMIYDGGVPLIDATVLADDDLDGDE